jgi:hypothetical protein
LGRLAAVEGIGHSPDQPGVHGQAFEACGLLNLLLEMIRKPERCAGGAGAVEVLRCDSPRRLARPLGDRFEVVCGRTIMTSSWCHVNTFF